MPFVYICVFCISVIVCMYVLHVCVRVNVVSSPPLPHQSLLLAWSGYSPQKKGGNRNFIPPIRAVALPTSHY